MIVATRFLEEHPDLVRAFLRAHVEATQFTVAHPAEAQTLANREIGRITTAALPARVLEAAFRNVDYTWDPLATSVAVMADHAYQLGFLGQAAPDLRALYDLDAAERRPAREGVASRDRDRRAIVSTGRALHLRGVGKTYQSGDRVVQALAPTDLDVAPGEFVCLLGASGCGKSTLLQLVAGLEEPTSGMITVDDVPVAGPSPDRVLLFQDAALFPWLSVEDNVRFGLKQSSRSRDEQHRIAQEWIEKVHLSGFEHAWVHQLSGGMRQRAALARALATDPSMLLMDEPFGALDALTRDRLHKELESLWAATRKTVVFVTHNVREAVALGDRVLVLSPRPGRIVGDFRITLPRPRALEDVTVMQQASEIMQVLRRALDAATDDALLEA